MKYANQVSDVLNAFSPEPLQIEQMGEFYCDNTMEFRMSDKYSSPIDDIFDMCSIQGAHNAFLLLGHKGCGKSTELNRMSEKFKRAGYQVKTIVCSTDLDLVNIVYSDLFILMGEALLKMADESGCAIDEKVLNRIKEFWSECEQTTVLQRQGNCSMESEIGVETPALITVILKAFAKIKADLKLSEETRVEYRKKISVHLSEWIMLLKYVADEIAKKTGEKQPIIIFEDLDKLNPEDAWNVFYNYAAILSGMSFPVIYTFPIGLSYDTRFAAVEGYFTAKTLPMIKIETMDGVPFDEGIDVIRKIVEKRADLNLFEENVLEKLIKSTGGSLRDLFHTINASAKRAERRRSISISDEDAERALEELKTSLTRRIEQKDYEFLVKIYRGNKELIEDKEILLKMLQASVVLEYNGKRWHNVHPLVARFLIEQGLIENVRE